MTHHELLLDNDQTSIQLRAGDTFDVWLDENLTTGYGWVVEPGGEDTASLPLRSSVFVPPHEGRIGQGGRRQFSFRAETTGRVALTFASRRPWESPGSSSAIRHLSIEIAPASTPG